MSFIAEGDREMTHHEVVELADAVAPLGGIASGIGAQHYGAQLVIEAEDRAAAIDLGTAEFVRAAERAGLPAWPITEVNALSEAEDEDDSYGGPA